MDKIKKFFTELYANIKFIYDFTTDPKISRLRVFLIWAALSVVSSSVIYVTIATWQVHVPTVSNQLKTVNPLIGMLFGTNILPILFLLTNGLRGYHKAFNDILQGIYSKFKRKTLAELQAEYGDEGLDLLRTVNIGRFVAGFVMLELIIVGWALFSYWVLGGNFTGLGLIGYIFDDLLMGAVVFLLEGFYAMKDALGATGKVYKLELATQVSDVVNKEELDQITKS